MLSFRTERSEVKNLGNVHVNINLYVHEILRFALNDKTDATYFLHITKRKWQQKVLDTFKTEPFLDRYCVEALKNLWIKE